MSTLPKTFLTEAEYLAIERAAESKSEYYQGKIFAMAGARANHNRIVMNLSSNVHQQLRQRRCEVYASDMRVHIPANTLYTYPDVSAFCGEPEFLDEDRDTLLNPTFIAEVLSETTERYDRGRKFELYRSIESLREYLLVASDRVHVDLYTRQPGGQWLLSSFGRLEEVVALDSIGCRLTVAELYEKAELAEPGLR